MMFGRLKVMYKCDYKYHSPSGGVANLWHCQCQCENLTELDVLTHSLTSGNTRSCGCLAKEYAKDVLVELGKEYRFKSNSLFLDANGYNKYNLSGEYGIGWTTQGDEFWFDLEDYDKIKNKIWSSKSNGKTKHKYIATRNPGGKGYIYLHRLVMGLDLWEKDKREVDHIFHNTFDNRKKNLRVCKHFQNTASQATRSNNTSGRKGVRWRKERNK